MSPMQSMKLMIWERMVDGVSRWFSTGCATRCVFVAVTLASAPLAVAQEPDASAQTNDAAAAEVLSHSTPWFWPPIPIRPKTWLHPTT